MWLDPGEGSPGEGSPGEGSPGCDEVEGEGALNVVGAMSLLSDGE